MLSKVFWSLLLPAALLMRSQNPGMQGWHIVSWQLVHKLERWQKVLLFGGYFSCHFSQCWITEKVKMKILSCPRHREELFSPPTLGWLQRSEDGLYGSCHGIKASLTPFYFAFSLLTNSSLWAFISFHQYSHNFQSFMQTQPHWSSSLGWPLAGVHLR